MFSEGNQGKSSLSEFMNKDALLLLAFGTVFRAMIRTVFRTPFGAAFGDELGVFCCIGYGTAFFFLYIKKYVWGCVLL